MKRLLAAAVVLLTASTANAESRIRPAGAFDVSYTRAWVYGVDVTLLDARLAAGFSTNAKEGTYVDVLGSLSIVGGSTEGGRAIHGLGVFGPMAVVHTPPLRFGGGLEIGYLSVDRSTPAGDQVGPNGRLTGLLGVEPFKMGNVAAVVDVRGHIGAWGEAAMPGVSLAVGVRY
jgi:hypothetical protein